MFLCSGSTHKAKKLTIELKTLLVSKMTEVQKTKAKLWIFLISAALCVGGIVYGVYKAKAMVNCLFCVLII